MSEPTTVQNPLWWLSFADDNGGGCLGVCIVQSEPLPDPDDEFIIAVRRSHKLKINPGGECQGTRIPEDMHPDYAGHLNKLFSKEEAAVLFGAKTQREFDEEDVDSSDGN